MFANSFGLIMIVGWIRNKLRQSGFLVLDFFGAHISPRTLISNKWEAIIGLVGGAAGRSRIGYGSGWGYIYLLLRNLLRLPDDCWQFCVSNPLSSQRLGCPIAFPLGRLSVVFLLSFRFRCFNIFYSLFYFAAI